MNRLTGILGAFRSGTSLRALAREFSYLTFCTVLLQVCNLILGFYSAKFIGLRHWGTWQLMYSAVGYIAIAELGLTSALSRLIPILRGAGKDEERERIVETATGFLTASTGIMVVLGVVLSLFFFRELSLSEIVAFSAYIAASRINQFVLLSFRTSNRFGLVSRNQLLQCPVLIFFGMPLVKYWGLLGFLLTYTVSIVISTWGTKAGWKLQKPLLNPKILWQLVLEGMPIYLNGYIFGVFSTMDRWFISKYLGRQAVGEYWLALVSVSAIVTIQQIIASQCYPRMANEWGRSGRAQPVERWMKGQIMVSFGGSAAILAIAAVCLPTICRSWLPQYARGVNPALILMAGACLLPVGGGSSAYLLVTGRQWLYLKLQCIPLLLSCGLWVLVASPRMSLSAAACVTTCAYGLYSGILFFWVNTVCRADRGDKDRPGGEVYISDWKTAPNRNETCKP